MYTFQDRSLINFSSGTGHLSTDTSFWCALCSSLLVDVAIERKRVIGMVH
jgi:hypothetical protein